MDYYGALGLYPGALKPQSVLAPGAHVAAVAHGRLHARVAAPCATRALASDGARLEAVAEPPLKLVLSSCRRRHPAGREAGVQEAGPPIPPGQVGWRRCA